MYKGGKCGQGGGKSVQGGKEWRREGKRVKGGVGVGEGGMGKVGGCTRGGFKVYWGEFGR